MYLHEASILVKALSEMSGRGKLSRGFQMLETLQYITISVGQLLERKQDASLKSLIINLKQRLFISILLMLQRHLVTNVDMDPSHRL